jgi:hypothetical protein
MAGAFLLIVVFMILTAAASFGAGIYLITRLNNNEPAPVPASTTD